MTQLQNANRRTILKSIPAAVLGGRLVTTASAARGGSPAEFRSGKSNMEIVAKHDHEADEHRFELSRRELSAGWTTITFDNQTDHTHFVNAIKVPQAMIDAAKNANETLRDFFIEHVAGPVQYLTDKSNPEKVADPADLSNKYSNPEKGVNPPNLLPPWIADFLPSGLVGLTSGSLTSMTTLNLKPGDYIIECYVKNEDRELHSYHGMVDQFAVTDKQDRNGKEPEATIELSLSSVDTGGDEENKGTIDVAEDVRAGQHTVAVHFKDQQSYQPGFHDVHLIRLDETTSIDDVNGWMDWTDPNQLVSDGTEPGTFLGGVQDIVTPELLEGKGTETAYFQVDLNPGAYAWVSEVATPADKGLMKPFIIPFEQN